MLPRSIWPSQSPLFANANYRIGPNPCGPNMAKLRNFALFIKCHIEIKNEIGAYIHAY
jgi:hypothetical protein